MTDRNFYLMLNIVKGISLFAFLAIITNWALQPAEAAAKASSRFTWVSTDSGHYNIRILRDSTDGRCWGSYTSSGTMIFGPIPCE
jgi:hypothetical protein